MLSRPSKLLAFGAIVFGSSLVMAQTIVINDEDSRRPRAQEPAAKETPESKKAKAEREALQESLYLRAYSLTKQTSDAEKAYILGRLAEASSKSHPAKSKEWAEETFSVTANLPNDMQRSQNEMAALQALSENDADRALELMAKMETPRNRDGEPMPDIRSALATMLFQRYWQKKGIEGLDTLTATARQMGEAGSYPYMAMGMLTRMVKRNNPDKAKDLVNEALAYFNRRQTGGFSNDQFANFLRQNREDIPTPLLKDLLEKLVSQAMATKEEGSTQMVLANEKGAAAKISSAASMMLFQLMPMIRDIDPDWATKLETQYQELKAAAEITRGSEQRMNVSVTRAVGGGSNNGAPPRAMMEEMQAMEIDELSARDPQRALKMNAELTDPAVRAASGARLAATIAKSNPEQAAELLKKAKEAIADAKEPADKLRILVGLAQAQAAMNDKAAFETTLATSFALGEELFRKGLDKNPTAPVFSQPGFDAMSRLTMSAVRMDYAATMSRLDAVRSPLLQALLLIQAAEGLDPDARPRPRGMRIRIES